ncbi:unnamed protein product [Prorocentrum cordatum]|uniref:Uncharacterized protein n=1 Tax=Prorocentrum cordatum TaxID=2364126 RepID=A0ABN9WWK3_9DINO|nr:unnamed protein product [Polarella glacialis]
MATENQQFHPKKYEKLEEWEADLPLQAGNCTALVRGGPERLDDLQVFLTELAWAALRGEISAERAAELLKLTPVPKREPLQKLLTDVLWMVGFSATEAPINKVQAIRAQGVTRLDLQSLTAEELAGVVGGSPSPALLALRDDAAESFQAVLRAPAVDLPALDMERRMRAAKRAGLLLLELAQFSAHRAELDNATRLRQAEQWANCFARGLALRFDDKSVNHALACWRRWLRWRETQSIRLSPAAAAPLALEVACFLDEVGARGPTAARGVLSGLRFLRDHLGLSQLPLDSPLLAGHRAVPHDHLERPMAKEISLRVWLFLLSVAGEGAGAVSLFAGLVAFLLVATLRFKHAQRFEFVQEQCTPRTLVGRVYRGKVRGGRPFYVAVPTCVHPHRPLFHELMGELQRHAPGAQFLIPDMQARGVTTYSLRRKLPTAADRLALPMLDRSALGDWADVVVAGEGQKQRACREPVAVRYSDARLESSAQVRRIILAAFHDAGSRNWLEAEDLRRLAPSVPEYREQVGRAEWGLAGAVAAARDGPALAPAAERSAQPAAEAVDVSSTGSSFGSDSESDEEAEATAPAEVSWLLPRGAKSYLHLASDQE